MRSYRYLHLDVFTDRLFGGNQLAVLLDARGLRQETMQAIAKEMNFSETTFVFPADRPDTDFRVRIFTPEHELPIAGHPTIGTAYALARAGVIGPTKDRVTFGLGVGPTPVSLVWKHDDLAFAWMTQPNPSFGPVISDIAGVAASLRLPPPAIAGTALPIQVVSCGVPFVFVPIATRRAVDNALLDVPEYDRCREAAGLDDTAVFLFSKEPGHDNATVYSRCFAPQYGIVEDAATGAASGPLGCYLVRHKVVAPERAGSMLSLQGVNMGRPSHVHMAIASDGHDIIDVRVGGEAVVAGEGTLYV